MGSTYFVLPDKLKNPMKGLINIKNNYNKCFLWRHTRHLNLVKTHPESIAKEDKNMVNDLKASHLAYIELRWYGSQIHADCQQKLPFKKHDTSGDFY